MSDEAAREEAYLNKMMNRGKDTAAVKKNVFGGGLEAARAHQGGGPAPKRVSTPTPAPTPAPAPVVHAPPKAAPKPQPTFVPPPLECEVVELDLPMPAPSKPTPAPYQPPAPAYEEEKPINLTLNEDAARKEEERMAKTIGRFAAPKSVLTPGTQSPPPTTYHVPSSSPAHTPSHSYQPSHQPSHPPSHTSSQPSHQPSQPSQPVHQPSYQATPTRAQPTNYRLDPSTPMQVGNITPSSDPSANFLPISNVGVNQQDIHVSIHKNGKNLQVRRSINEGGQVRNETKSLTLPYQVFPHTTAATYYPGKNNGELSIKLGKELPKSNSSELEVARFTVNGVPGSSQDRVQITVQQEADHFVFRPGVASPFDTHFVVVIVGSSFEFRSVHSFEEGNSVKTVNGKQTISLPIPPTRDQVDVDYDTITVWPNRGGSGIEEVVADFDVSVVLGQ